MRAGEGEKFWREKVGEVPGAVMCISRRGYVGGIFRFWNCLGGTLGKGGDVGE